MMVNQSPVTSIRAAQPVPNPQPNPKFQNNQPQQQQQLYRFQQEDDGGHSQTGNHTHPNYPPQSGGFYQAGFQPAPLPRPQNQGVWRSGTEVVLHKHATLPGCCVKCNQPVMAAHHVFYSTQKFRWHNPLLYIALISPLIYCILALALSERFSVDIPLCGSHSEERKTVKNYLLFGSLFAFAAGVFFVFFDAVGMTILTFIMALLGLSIAHEYFYKSLRVKKVDKDYIYLQGASPNFLNSLPYC